MKRKIIFLDIDGVICLASKLEKIYPFQVWIDKFLLEHRIHKFTIHGVYYLRELVRANDAKIVISSSWRTNGLKLLQELFEERGVCSKEDIIDTTTYYNYSFIQDYGYYDLEDVANLRQLEIQHWLDNNSWNNYVILDDRAFPEDAFVGHKVRTSHETGGLNKDSFMKSMSILNDPSLEKITKISII